MTRTSSTVLFTLALTATACRGEVSLDDTDKFDPRDDASDTEAQGSDTEDPSDTEEQVATCPEITVAPTEVEIDDVEPDAVYTEAIIITNDCEGDTDLVVAGSLSGDAEWALTGAALTLAPGESGSFEVTFSPVDRMRHDAVLTLATNDEDEASVEVPVTGIAGIDDDYDGYASEESGGTDCDDGDDTIYEGAEDTWYDGIDSNCDGASDYDQDGDGYDSSDYGGEDCDDADADINPDATETWYDGTDQDCSGGSDYDQDGDGFDSDGYGGDDCDDADADINPDADETWYDGTDSDCDGASDYDQDGDGYDSSDYGGEDCDDTDADINPDADEVWNGADDDCDDDIDDLQADDAADAMLEGDSDDYLGYRSNLAAGDIDDDGDVELVIGAPYGARNYEGHVYVLSLPDYASWSGDASSDAEAELEGDGSNNYWGNIGRNLGDVDGDGVLDVVVGGNDSDGGWWSSGGGDYGVGLYLGGSGISGTVSQGDAEVLVDETSASSSTRAQVNAGLDLTGDGYAEVIIGDYLYSYNTGSRSQQTYAGGVAVFEGDGLSGDYSLDEADWTTVGDDDYDYLGTNISGTDLDGDGYDDMLIGASGEDEGGTSAGAMYVIYGESSLSDSDDNIEDRYDAKLIGDDDYGYVGLSHAVFGDVDADGTTDLVVAEPGNEVVYVLWDASSLSSGDTDLDDFDLLIEGDNTPDYFGLGLAIGDTNADGYSDLLIGAPDEDQLDSPSSRGMAYLFDGATISGESSVDEDDASMSVRGASRNEVFGQSVLLTDMDGDGNDDAIIDAPKYDSDKGRVYFYIAP